MGETGRGKLNQNSEIEVFFKTEHADYEVKSRFMSRFYDFINH